MQSAPEGERGISKLWNAGFYILFLGYLAQSGMNDDEDDDIIFPRGRVPIMTIHQAKGLEFPFVFVGSLGATADGDNPVYLLEDEFAKFPGNASRTFERADSATRAELDIVRSSYVAFSRAEWALILVGSDTHFKKGAIPCGPDRTWLRYQAVKL
jgi:DNA helicase-2/ATP-dependent DNA helicase PcrA